MSNEDRFNSPPRQVKPQRKSGTAAGRLSGLLKFQDKDERKSFWEKTSDIGAKLALIVPVRLIAAGGLAAGGGSKELLVVLGIGAGVDIAWTIIRSRLKDHAAVKKRTEQLGKHLDVDTDPLEQHKEARDRIDAVEQAVAEHSEPIAKIESLEDRQLDQGQKLGQVSQTARMAHNKVNAHDQQLSAIWQQLQSLGAQQGHADNMAQDFGAAVRQAFEQQNQHFEQRVQQAVAAEIQRMQAGGVLPQPATHQVAPQQFSTQQVAQSSATQPLAGQQEPAAVNGFDDGRRRTLPKARCVARRTRSTVCLGANRRDATRAVLHK